MADQILDAVRSFVDAQIDFDGQRLSELLATVSLCACGIIAFIVGYVLQDIKLAVYIGLLGTATTFLAVVPAWPFFNQHPVKWLPAGSGMTFDNFSQKLSE